MSAEKAARSWVEESALRAAGAAAIPIPVPGAHTALTSAIEAYMIYHVAGIYGEKLSLGEALGLVPTLGAGIVARKAASSIVGETVGWIPIAGWLLKGAASGGTAFAMGVAAVTYFEKKYPGRDAIPFDTLSIKDWVKAALAQLGVKK
ncbi:DUF697 domain-containing protein [Myxococcus sp. CA051A]|uniref:DUF697 domain-containing protein n=1 Tax=Myxococcus llanfairpwllgwyngyllgogerychwyrndrobwllllantysiliogogogochensis TaxID=2590453 RepID=A0A540WTI6_9BACT|nr:MULTISPECIES: DUF697 domain-containing protein [Myxococcus]NTX15824.1 DUF697 domain-containing protein [Myxococcus sp. CA056]NTX33986.1 DUF697 domain-containing protein [Myxococcus sp. CA033]NTX53411.1 DUF697 domain-containing protein [Myxococcus sp. CA039A]NTX65307.1 DUF697 domain-containing protein [Myxococcus sp. CA051A]TQF12323.1 DUF697 domain-containing protein [Myxococcus llanfairpwllgwyngyllgogerychwyrndrobwllllantysiliogogogochensis]